MYSQRNAGAAETISVNGLLHGLAAKYELSASHGQDGAPTGAISGRLKRAKMATEL